MLNIIGKRNWYFLISFLTIIPGVISLFVYGLNLSIDFTGGSRSSYVFEKQVDQKTISSVKKVYETKKIEVVNIQGTGNTIFIKSKEVTDKQNTEIVKELKGKIGNFKQEEYVNVGPVIGQEITVNAFKSIVLASVLIIIYIAWSFRSIPKPASSWKFGVCAIAALLHDVLLLVGLFSLFGHFLHVEIDSLFVTAVLTVIGFSVHDTIVVFDRIRENLLKITAGSFEKIANDSILQTLTRSLNTSFTAMLVLLALMLFGGESVRWFVAALFIGIISGTYSSIFNAAAILVSWHEWDQRKRIKN